MQDVVLNWPRSTKRWIVVGLDVVLALFSMWLSFTLRLDVARTPVGAEWLAYLMAPLLAIPIFVRFGLYRAIFRYTGVSAILTTGAAVAVYGAALLPFIWGLFQWEGVPRSLIVLQPLIFLLFVAASRTLAWHWLAGRAGRGGARLLIYGAGEAGAQTAAALAGTQQYLLLGFLDDDVSKLGRSINGIRVFSASDAATVVDRLSVTDILLALPSASRQRRNRIIGELQSLPVRIRSLPALADLASGRVSVDDFQDLDVEDLLGREPVAAWQKSGAYSLRGQIVLVTGAGGSIGSELCRQIARDQPAKLLLLENSEFALYQIHRELDLLASQGELNFEVVPLLANVCNLERISAICKTHRPAVVYHAAAYKHVPMVESNPGESVVNNVFGTLNMAHAAMDAEVDHFVLISTDKAVRPTNIMGASKRIAEMILQSLAAHGKYPFENREDDLLQSNHRTCFSMVRFGNVLGSSGSVVPLFRSQIADGGPVTVTHPEITRYFMTIPEAAQLVLHAGAMANGGDLFVLDMGKPVKILDLAKKMIALSGLTVRNADRPSGDISITFTGLRPGEKLFEELLIGENPLPTDHPRIIRAREDFMVWPVLETHLQALLSEARVDNIVGVKKLLRLLVPGYAPEVVVE